MIESHREIVEIFEELKVEILELHDIERSANAKFIRELMKELVEAYELIENLTASLTAFKSLHESSSK